MHQHATDVAADPVALPGPIEVARAQVVSTVTVLWRVVSSATRWQLSFMYDGAKVQRGGIKQDAVQVLSQGRMLQHVLETVPAATPAPGE